MKLLGYSDFFYQDVAFLREARKDMLTALLLLGREPKDIGRYKTAFDYFVASPERYDGSSFVGDLFLIRYNRKDSKGRRLKLSPDSMLHDYEYIIGANRSFKKKIKSDIKYYQNLRRNGKGRQWLRLFGLLIITPVYVPYQKLKNK